MTTDLPKCFYCKRFIEDKSGSFVCKAFPKYEGPNIIGFAMPDKILKGDFDFSKPCNPKTGVGFKPYDYLPAD